MIRARARRRKDAAFYDKIINDPFLNDLAWEINEQSARQCREWAERVGSADGKQRFVAGAMGPLTVSLSNSPDADDAGFRVVTFDQVKSAYVRCRCARLSRAASDLLLVETIFDSLNAKAAVVAIQEVFEEDHLTLPVMISAAVGRGGETMISAQTVEALWDAVEHAKPISIGLNCSLGPDLMYPFLTELSQKASAAISCYPNAGLPNPLSPTGFDLEPQDMARHLGAFARAGLVNIAGGCCGNTPEHIAAIARALADKPPRGLVEAGHAAAAPVRVSVPRAHRRPRRWPRRRFPLRPLRIAALHPAGGRVHHDRRADQCRRVSQIRQANQGRKVRAGRKCRAPTGRKRSQRHRYLHGRGDDRWRRRDVAIIATPRQ